MSAYCIVMGAFMTLIGLLVAAKNDFDFKESSTIFGISVLIVGIVLFISGWVYACCVFDDDEQVAEF
jgi:uncharacterized membrane protein HdeD (DUF308 family)